MNFLNGQLSTKILGAYLIHSPSGELEVSARPFHALVFRIKGSAVFTIGTNKTMSSEGDVLYMPADTPYRVCYEENNEIIAIHFKCDANETKIENHNAENSSLYGLFLEAKDIWNSKEPGYYYKAMSVFYQIMEKLSLPRYSFPNKETEMCFKEAICYMEENYLSKDFSVAKMVEKACMSNTYFRKLFMQAYGKKPIDFIISKKVEYADKLLVSGKYSISEISEMCGFEDAKYFSRVIKKHYGVPPSKLHKFL